ncbi:MAG: alkaline phosphatase D family protein [Planctomyces sp.]
MSIDHRRRPDVLSLRNRVSGRLFAVMALLLRLMTQDQISDSHAAEITHGPILGHLNPATANVFARVSEVGQYEIRIYPNHASTSAEKKDSAQVFSSEALEENDMTVHWNIDGLQPASVYRIEILDNRGQRLQLDRPGDLTLTTPPAANEETIVRLAFGSCAWDVSHPVQNVWTTMADAGVSAAVLLGDTPYIDSTDLSVLRKRYRDFWGNPQLRAISHRFPFYATWDDHDFGPDDALGRTPNKQNSRKAFMEYHANPFYGTEGRPSVSSDSPAEHQGIFTKFRRGPVEVFLIDTRWFANTEPSPFNPERMTLIGKKQWDWLRQALKESQAPVKVLASGMMWNEAAYPGKIDYWMAYPYEREGLFRYLKQERISGVILVGGDIHRSRHFVHPTTERVGYRLHEFVASPLAENPAPYNNIPSPWLRFDGELKESFLLLTVSADPENLSAFGDETQSSGNRHPLPDVSVTAQFVSEGKIRYSTRMTTSELTAPTP